MKGMTTIVWHKDGNILGFDKESIEGKVYINGELKNTDGLWEHIVIVGEAPTA